MKCSKCGAELETGANFCIVCGQTAPPVQKIRIGRSADCEVVLNHEKISRLHAIIVVEGSQYRITDQSSLNGVFVNGQRISTALIKPGDHVSLGKAFSLDWKQLLDAFSRGSAGSPGASHTGPSPVFYVDEEKKPKKSNSLPWVIVIVALALVGLGLGSYFLFFRGGKDDVVSFDIEHSYVTKESETSELSERRSKLETMEKILEQMPAKLGFEHSILMAYCLVDVSIGEPQNVFNQRGVVEKISRTASANVSQKEFDKRHEQLRGRQDYMSQIQEAEERLRQAKLELNLAEASLVAPKKIEETVKKGIEVLEELAGVKRDSTKTEDDKPRVDNSLEAPRQNYETAIRKIEEIYESLNHIKLSLAESVPTRKGGRVLK
ncbi:MAG: FHA domain-containing protein [Candidatus Cloacimonetes bacterium]|nr:FHA domain-containing protein [Candidatus Cloacimonadota bacterium]